VRRAGECFTKTCRCPLGAKSGHGLLIKAKLLAANYTIPSSAAAELRFVLSKPGSERLRGYSGSVRDALPM